MSTISSQQLPDGMDAPANAESRYGQRAAWIAWSAASLFLVYQILLQNSFSGMQGDVGRDLKLTTEDISLIASIFFLTYAAMQIPAGVLIDRFGTGWVLPPAILAVGAGVFVLAGAQSLSGALAGRLIMGTAGSFSFLGVTAITNRRISSHRIGMATGLMDFAFSLGAALAAISTLHLLIAFNEDWRLLLRWSALLSIPIALICWFAIGRGKPESPRQTSLSPSFWSDFRATLFNRRLIMIGLIYGGFIGPLLGLSGLWNVPLQEAFNRSREDASTFTTCMLIGIMIGAPTCGAIADRIERYIPFLVGGLILTVVSIYPLIYVSTPGPYWLVLSQFVILGIGLSPGVLCFPLACREVDRRTAGMASAVVNCIGLLTAGAFQFLPGEFIGDTKANELPILQEGLAIFVIWPLLGLGLILILYKNQMRYLSALSRRTGS
ncbi:MAG: hypothetical protein CBC35_04905 [Planctomycetes bacterium TMED75]|nr:hypothetical protein [Planctomycetaceae bacterium]OUU93830.1 MAG: hypothetical protein CBC35_04905 [Planctomycetes bacterium TMED75]